MPKLIPIRVMIVEDSQTVREFLEHLIAADPRLEVVASVDSGEACLKLLDEVKPDVISMDIRLPGMNGVETTQRVMSQRPTPIVAVSANVDADELKISMSALRAGALAVVEKPVHQTHESYDTLAKKLCTQLAIMSQVKVIRQRAKNRAPAQSLGQPGAGLATPAVTGPAPNSHPRMIGMVASPGGPRAWEFVLADLPADFPLPILLVQHISASFHRGFVDWLARICSMPVQQADEGRVPAPGQIYVAPSEQHLLLRHGCMVLDHGPPVCAQRHSWTVLLESMAQDLGSRAAGVVLTGMGDDGAAGLAAIRAAGGMTIAEHESTAVVNGMPAAAIKLGAACEIQTLDQIGKRLLQLAARPNASQAK